MMGDDYYADKDDDSEIDMGQDHDYNDNADDVVHYARNTDDVDHPRHYGDDDESNYVDRYDKIAIKNICAQH